MANNSRIAQPYSYQIPSGTVNKVQLTNPNMPGIQWPSINGGSTPTKPTIGTGIFRRLFA
jgi:hypothetical protein